MGIRKSREVLSSASPSFDDTVISAETIAELRETLKTKPRDLLLFDLLTQTGIKVKDALCLKAKDLSGLVVGDNISYLCPRTKDSAIAVVTKRVRKTLTRYLQDSHLKAEDYLFKSRKGSGPLSLTSASHLIRKWFKEAGVTGHTGVKSLHTYCEGSFRANAAEHQKRVLDNTHHDSIRFLTPVESATLQDTVYQQLFQAIVSGRIPPGSRLVIGKIAKQMKVSPMPVREALQRLQATGYLSPLKKRGNIVNRLSTENMREITNIRLILEPMAARQAAISRSPEVLTLLEDLHKEYTRAIKKRDSDRFLLLNKDFHYTIYRESGMPILFQIIEILWARASPYIYILMRESLSTDLQWSLYTHAEMIDALRRRDPDRIEKVLKFDLSKAAQDVISMIEHLRGANLL